MAEPCEITTSVVMSFAEKLEETSAKFYRNLAERYRERQEDFLTFAKESDKNKTLLIRTYQETISDALEACFSFKSLNPNDYVAETFLAADLPFRKAIEVALGLEEKANEFYNAAAEQSKSLLATITRAFSKAAETRKKRKTRLREISNAPM